MKTISLLLSIIIGLGFTSYAQVKRSESKQSFSSKSSLVKNQGSVNRGNNSPNRQKLSSSNSNVKINASNSKTLTKSYLNSSNASTCGYTGGTGLKHYNDKWPNCGSRHMHYFYRNYLCNNQLWNWKIENYLVKWTLINAIVNSFEVTATLKNYSISPDKSFGVYNFNITKGPANEKFSQMVSIVVQKPEIADVSTYEIGKDYTMQVSRYKAFDWKTPAQETGNGSTLLYYVFSVNNTNTACK